ncbi:MAG: T9SS type A sorting domain-containing protein [Bacteroidota bacterium]
MISRFATNGVQHVVMTRDASGGWEIWVDNVQVFNGFRGGNFNNWSGAYKLAIANELTNNRAWLGEIYMVSIYDQALTPTEIAQNYQAGPHCVGSQGSKQAQNDDNSGAEAGTAMFAPNVDVFPNPFREGFTLRFTSEEVYGQLSVRVMDKLGQVVHEGNYMPDDGKFLEQEFEMRDVTAGVYFVEVKSGNFMKRLKLVKQ